MRTPILTNWTQIFVVRSCVLPLRS